MPFFIACSKILTCIFYEGSKAAGTYTRVTSKCRIPLELETSLGTGS